MTQSANPISSVETIEMPLEEAQIIEQSRHLEKQQPKASVEEKLPVRQETEQKPWWLLAIVIPIAFLALVFLAPVCLCMLSMVLNALISLLSR